MMAIKNSILKFYGKIEELIFKRKMFVVGCMLFFSISSFFITLYGYLRYGYEFEMNPFIRYMMKIGLYPQLWIIFLPTAYFGLFYIFSDEAETIKKHIIGYSSLFLVRSTLLFLILFDFINNMIFLIVDLILSVV